MRLKMNFHFPDKMQRKQQRKISLLSIEQKENKKGAAIKPKSKQQNKEERMKEREHKRILKKYLILETNRNI